MHHWLSIWARPNCTAELSWFIRKKICVGVARDNHATLGPAPGGSESGKKKLWAAFGRALLGQTGSTETGRPDAYLMPGAKMK
jgi:hypothetical protein